MAFSHVIGRYLTHPQVVIDPDVPVDRWGLNKLGRSRIEALIQSNTLQRTTYIVSSAEQKALDTARPIAKALGASLEIRDKTHENDRTATGYLPESEFQQVADAFFASPNTSTRGWETAIDAQSRIVSEVEIVLANHVNGDLLIVGHGAVGTLLYCHYANLPISRKLDQFGGGGCLFSFDIAARHPLSHWASIEDAIS